MADKKRTGGLGAAAFFNNEPPASAVGEGQDKAEPRSKVSPSKPKKVRTTVTLYPETLALMDALKVQARLEGHKATYSDVLHEAIQDLAAKKGIEVGGEGQ